MKSLFSPILKRFTLLSVSAYLLFLASFAGGQVVPVPYKILITPQPTTPPCDTITHAGDDGTLYPAPGFPARIKFPVDRTCNLESCEITPIASVSTNSAPCLGVSPYMGVMCPEGPNGEERVATYSGGTYYATCDGFCNFVLGADVVHYAGSLKTDACGDSLPADGKTFATIFYESPGSNVLGGISFNGPLVWSLTVNTAGAILTNIGAMSAQIVAGTKAGIATVRATCTNGCVNCYVETTVTFYDPNEEGSGGGGCKGGCPGSKGGGPPIFGSGTTKISGLNSIGLEMNLGAGLAVAKAGSMIEPGSAQTLIFPLTTGSALAYGPLVLEYPWSIENVIVVRDNDGFIQQVRVPQGLVDVEYFGTPYDDYDLKFYASTNVKPRGFDGYFTNSGPALVTWHFESGPNILHIFERRTGEADRESTFTWETNDWKLIRPDSSGAVLLIDWSTNTYPVRTETSIVTDANGATNQVIRKQYVVYPGFERLTQEIHGMGTDARTNTYSYYTNGLIQNLVRPDGYWEHYVYDYQGRPTNIFSAFGNQGVTTVKSLCRMIENTYTNSVVSGSVDDLRFNPTVPRRVVEYLLDQPVSLRYHVSCFEKSIDIQCVATDAEWDNPNNLFTTNTFCTNGFFYRQLQSVERPDHTMDIFQRTFGTNVTNSTTTVLSGVPDSYKTNIVDGTKTVTVKGSLGQLVSVTTTDIRSGIVIAQESYSNYDVYNRPQKTTHLDGTWEFSESFCCGDLVTTNREGSVATKTYDALNRLLTTTANGITIGNTYDAAGNILKVERIGTNNSVITLQRNAYDTAGKLIATTNAVGDVRLFSSVDSAAGETNTTIALTNSSSGPARIEARYLDGQTKSITGGLVHPVRYEYGPTNGGTFTKEIKLDANGGTSEWIIQFYDTAGRPYKTLYADGASSQTIYNSTGQVSKEVDADGVTTLYRYNAKGERAFTVLDVDRNGIINSNATDRITWTTNYVVNNGATDVQRSETRVWANDNTNLATLISVMDSAVSGLATWSTNFGLVSRTETVFPGVGVRYSKSTGPDGTFTTTRFTNGLVTSMTRTNNTNQLSATVFGYDAHNRQIFVTDARNGTTTNAFDALDRLVSRRTPVPATGQAHQRTGYRFDALGRVTAITNADDTLLYKEYFDSGELKKTHGAREYPVEYTYDAQGRMKTMKTWRTSGDNSTAATTTWNYQTNRGWLVSKTYDGGAAGPTYGYTPAGRLYQRVWARGVSTTYAPNAAGEIGSIDYSDSTPDVTYTYDRLGRRTTIVDGAGTHMLSYELDGRLLSETNTAGVLAGLGISNDYDTLHRRSSVALNSQGSTLNTAYGYDDASRLIGVTNGVNTASYSYVANSPLVSQIDFKNSGTSRMTTTKSFDYLNRLTQISSTPTADTAAVLSYAYTNSNQRTSITNADGSRWQYDYDALGQVTSGKKYWSDSTPVLGQQFDYAFDDIGNRKTVLSGGDASGTDKRVQTYSANALNQYTQRTVPGYLDILGTATNTATVTVNATATSRKGDYYRAELTVPNGSKAVWQSITNVAVLASGTNDFVTNSIGNQFVPRSVETFGYDADGNQTSDGRWAFVWDGENRLVQMQSLSSAPVGSSNRLTFVYDQQGRRISKTTESFMSGVWSITLSDRFVYDGWNLLAELNATNNSAINTFVWGLDQSGSLQGAGGVGGLLATTTTNAGTHFVGYDGNGNVALLASASSGATTANYEYDPFGNVLRATGPMALLNPFRFSTKYTEGESGFNYYGYRSYNPTMGRWLSRDPIAESGHRATTIDRATPKLLTGDDLYTFVKNNVPAQVDADGRIAPIIVGGAAVITAVVACALPQALIARSRYPDSSDKFKHCWASCRIAKTCGAGVAELAGLGKEARDRAVAAYCELDPNNSICLGGQGDFWDSVGDLYANQQCIPWETWIFGAPGGWIGSLCRQSCEDCCKAKVGYY